MLNFIKGHVVDVLLFIASFTVVGYIIAWYEVIGLIVGSIVGLIVGVSFSLYYVWYNNKQNEAFKTQLKKELYPDSQFVTDLKHELYVDHCNRVAVEDHVVKSTIPKEY